MLAILPGVRWYLIVVLIFISTVVFYHIDIDKIVLEWKRHTHTLRETYTVRERHRY